MNKVDKIVSAISEIIASDNILKNGSQLNLTYELSESDFYSVRDILSPTLIIQGDKFVMDYSLDNNGFFVEFKKIK